MGTMLSAKRSARLPSAVAPFNDLRAALAAFDPGIVDREARQRALEGFLTRSSGRERPGRYWRIDLESIAPAPDTVHPASTGVTIENSCARIIACDLPTAAHSHPDLLHRALGVTEAASTKYGALTTAFAQLGAFVYVPADVAAGEPISITYDLPGGTAAFPYTIVLAERGAQATIVQRLCGEAAFVCGIDELIAQEGANVTFASVQQLCANARSFQTRRARPQRDATVSWACAEVGAELAVTEIAVVTGGPGVTADVTNLFFPNAKQHVDALVAIDHAVGDCSSQTLVKSAAVGSGQARFLGSIRIAPQAQGSNAALRDDALLLSPRAHIDSVPALEIAANDVKAYHGATVGAIDVEQIFYMESRGLQRDAAERMIALGFFEPAIERFPTQALRDELRDALARKLQ